MPLRCEVRDWYLQLVGRGFPRMVGKTPTNMGVFLLKMIILGCAMGVPPFKEPLKVNQNSCMANILLSTSKFKSSQSYDADEFPKRARPKEWPKQGPKKGTFDQRYPPKKGGSRHSLPDTSDGVLQTASETSQQHRILSTISLSWIATWSFKIQFLYTFCHFFFAGIMSKHVLLLSPQRVPARTPGVGCPIVNPTSHLPHAAMIRS